MPKSDSQETLQLLKGLRSDFDLLRQRGGVIRIRLIHRATNAEAEGVIGWPLWDGATIVPGHPAGHRDCRQNLDENGNPKFIEPPMVDANGTPIVDSNGKGLDITMPAHRRIELAGDGKTIQQLQALCNRGGRLAKECCDEQAMQPLSDFQFREPRELWWSLVFEFAWSERHPLLTAERKLWRVVADNSVIYYPYNLEELRRLPPGIPGITVPSNWLKRLPEAYVSEIDDAVAACVDSCNVLLNNGTGTSDAHKPDGALPELTEPPKQTDRYDALQRVWGIVETRLRLSDDSPITEQQKDEAYREGEKEIQHIFCSDQLAMGTYYAAVGLGGASLAAEVGRQIRRNGEWVKTELRLRIEAYCRSRASEKSEATDTNDRATSPTDDDTDTTERVSQDTEKPASHDVVLHDDDLEILRALNNSGKVLDQYKIEAEVHLSRKTIAKRLKWLRGQGLTHRPRGERAGEAITDFGRELLARYNT